MGMWLICGVVLAVMVAVMVVVGQRNARAGIDWGGIDDVDGQSLNSYRPTTLRDRLGLERWSELWLFARHIVLVVALMISCVWVIDIWSNTVLLLLARFNSGNAINLFIYQLIFWVLGVLLAVSLFVVENQLRGAIRAQRVSQRLAIVALSLGTFTAVGWLLGRIG